MSTTWIWACAAGAVLLVAGHEAEASAEVTAAPGAAPADSTRPGTPATVEASAGFRELDLSGPRMGVTIAGSGDRVRRNLEKRGMSRVVSQFGWHFEHRVIPLRGGPVLVTEAIPLFGGFEYGKILPSLTLALGVRLASGIEFGMGPSLSPVTSSGHGSTALVLALGRTLDFNGVDIPVNLAMSTNSAGTMFTCLAGYAIPRAAR